MFQPRIGVVTGAARGMGAASAQLLSPSVDRLVLADLDEVDLDELGLAVPADVARVDVADPDDVEALADRARELGTVEWLVHAAGVSPTMGAAQLMFAVDLLGSLLVVEAFGPVLAAGGSAVLFASSAAHLAGPHAPNDLLPILDDPAAPGAAERFVEMVGGDPGFGYAMAKLGVLRLAQRTAVAWAERGVRVNSVSPGVIETPMGCQELESEGGMRQMLHQTPMARLGRAEELAAAVKFLVSDAASYVTGTDVLVDGGLGAALRTR